MPTNTPHFLHPSRLIATCFGIGHLPFAPGTWGSVFGYYLVVQLWYVEILINPGTMAPDPIGINPAWLLLGATLFITLIGTWACEHYAKTSGTSDPSEAVIDEVAGIFVAATCLMAGLNLLAHLNPDIFFYHRALFPLWMVAGFILFRFFDIQKPGLISRAEKAKPVGLGIMLDDLVAGLFAGIATLILVAIAGYTIH